MVEKTGDQVEETAHWAVSLDFASKTERRIRPADAGAEISSGRFVWIDLDAGKEEDTLRGTLGGLLTNSIVTRNLATDSAVTYERYDDCLHVTFTACQLQGILFVERKVHVLLGDGFLITVHRGVNPIVDRLRSQYKTDFTEFAKTPSFLIYDICDILINHYQEVQREFEEQVESIQMALVGEVDESVFGRVSELGSDLLRFRKVLLPTRTTLTELSTRKSPYVSEETQSFLSTMLHTVDRILQDLIVDRDILAESLNLHVSLVAHRTNRVVTRLTAVSMLFLPLTFMCGVYGMNFEVFPELKWRSGYGIFWLLAILITVSQLIFLRKKKLI